MKTRVGLLEADNLLVKADLREIAAATDGYATLRGGTLECGSLQEMIPLKGQSYRFLQRHLAAVGKDCRRHQQGCEEQNRQNFHPATSMIHIY